MNPQLEKIETAQSQQSFLYFKVEETRFLPYWHYHPEIELTYIEHGAGLRFVGDNIAPFANHDLVLIGKNLPHQWVSGETGSQMENQTAHVVQFPISILQPFMEMAKTIQVLQLAERGLLFSDTSLGEMIMEMEGQPAERRLLQLWEILLSLAGREFQILSSISYSSNNPFKKHQNRIAEVTSYLIQNLDKPISLPTISAQQHMTPSSFSRWFKQSLGKGFLEYLKALRIEKACQMLLHTDLPVAQIAFQVGFESLSSFNRSFKAIKNILPSTYRNTFFQH